VLTAAHVLNGAASVSVRFNADQAGEWGAQAEQFWADTTLDVALLRIVASTADPPGSSPSVGPVPFGRISRPPVECETLGFPLFKVREDRTLLDPNGYTSKYRDSEHATGTASSWSNRREGTMAVNLRAPERDPVPGRSPWEGMSGAAVFSAGYLIGVVGEHHRSDGLGTLAAYSVERWYENLEKDQISELSTAIGIPAEARQLAEVGGGSQMSSAAVPRQLPGTTPAFTGRDREMRQLDQLVDAASGDASTSTVVISAIDGMAGVGKTALAIHFAHRVADRFPDGQLFADLYGFTRGYKPRPAREVLHGFLRALGVPSGRIPSDLEGRAALYRERLSGTRTLIVLDNARTEAQVRPLLPAADGCLVLVTSRRRLKALDDAHVLPLDVLPETDAIRLFRIVAGSAQTVIDERLVLEITALCGRLPLAVRIAAALFRNRPTWNLDHLARLLRDQAHRIRRLQDGDRDLFGLFTLSYANLTLPQKRAFCLLGLVPGPDFDACSVSSIADTSLDTASEFLEELVDHNLLIPQGEDRYRFHDLLRLYAADRASHDQNGEKRTAAERRLIDYYLHTAFTGDRMLSPNRPPIDLGEPSQGSRPLTLSDAAQAQAWFDAEYSNLRAVQQLAVDSDRNHAVWQLAWTLDSFSLRRGHHRELLTSWEAGLAAANRAGDPVARMRAHRLLGNAYTQAGRHAEAIEHLKRSLAIASSNADLFGQAHAHRALTAAWARQGENAQAMKHAVPALRLFRRLEDPVWEADALNSVGWLHACLGRYDKARKSCEQALTLARGHDDQVGQAQILDSLGYIAHMTGSYSHAVGHYQQALILLHEIGDAFEEANTLDRLGQSFFALGQHDSALQTWEQSLALYRAQQRTADIDRILGQLSQLAEGISKVS
jgi:tetratricopeptide (TPR) repeat protein